MIPQSMAPRHLDYFELTELRKSALPLKQTTDSQALGPGKGASLTGAKEAPVKRLAEFAPASYIRLITPLSCPVSPDPPLSPNLT